MTGQNSRIGKASLIIPVAVALIFIVFSLLASTGTIGREMTEGTKNKVVRFWLSGSFIRGGIFGDVVAQVA
jgi:hypothetical protein